MSKAACLMPIAALSILLPHLAVAQAASYKILHTFKGNPDGAEPHAAVIIDPNGGLYGTTFRGGTSGSGTVFKLTESVGNPWVATVLYSFSGPNRSYPNASLVFGKNGVLYGTTHSSTATGTIFQLVPPVTPGDTWAETDLYSFGGNSTLDGAVLIGPGGTLYTTIQGYIIPGGSVVALTPPSSPGGGWTESTIWSFPSPGGVSGSNPFAGLVSEGEALYGTNYYDGAGNGLYGGGVVFALTPPASPGGAWTDTIIYNFGLSSGDGTNPEAALTVGPGGTLYGTTVTGGSNLCATTGVVQGCGTVFQLTPPSTPTGAWTESVIYNFTGANGDGAAPVSAVVLGNNGELYGTTPNGGSAASNTVCPGSYYGLAGCGIVFQLTPPTTPGSPWTEKVLHSFTGQNGDGSIPLAGLALSSAGVLYGTTSGGGAGAGTVFSIKP